MNNEAIKQKTNELAELLRNSDEHRIYLDAKTRAYGNNLPPPLMQTLAFLKTDMHRIFECCPIFGHK